MTQFHRGKFKHFTTVITKLIMLTSCFIKNGGRHNELNRNSGLIGCVQYYQPYQIRTNVLLVLISDFIDNSRTIKHLFILHLT